MAEHAPSTPAPKAPPSWPAAPHLLPAAERWRLLLSHLQDAEPALAEAFAAARDAGEDLDDLLAEVLKAFRARRAAR